MDSIDLWKVLSELNTEIVSDINKIIIFGENGSEVLFSTSDEKVYGFGNNSFGELGLGHKNVVKEPQNIVELNDKQIIDFSYGLRHVFAKTITGKLYSWGDNSVGQLGNGTKSSDYRPKLNNSLSDKCVIAMSCGSYHTLVLTDDNQLYGLGHNSDGQIGCGNFINQLINLPIKINGFNDEILVSIACGAAHSLALTKSGSVYSWGRNNCGQLGICDTNPKLANPRKILVNNVLLFIQIACGSDHSLILSDCGDVFAFGDNSSEKLGLRKLNLDSYKDYKYKPKKIDELRYITDISSNFLLKLSMAKQKNSTFLVWGECLNGINKKPLLTQLNSFNEIVAKLSIRKITVKPIEISESQINCISNLNRISHKLSVVFNDKEFSDIVFKVENKEIFVNKFILRVNSDYFRNKYSVKSTEIRESSTESFDDIENFEIIDNYSYEVFYSYLKYIYTECVEIENQYLNELLVLSIEHKDEDLIIKCLDRMLSSDKNSITIERIAELLKLSVDNNMNELKAKCIKKIKIM